MMWLLASSCEQAKVEIWVKCDKMDQFKDTNLSDTVALLDVSYSGALQILR